MRLQLGASAYRRNNGNLPEQSARNLFFETAPTATSAGVLISRKGLGLDYPLTNVRGAFQQPGLFGGDIFSVAGDGLYRGTTLLGPIYGVGPVTFAAIRNILTGSEELVACAGQNLVSYNGTDTVSVSFPDGQNVTSVTALAQRFVATVASSHAFYWSDTDDGRTWQGDAFASAEASPDDALQAIAMRGTLYIVGQSSIEPFFPTGDNDLPFQAVLQSSIPRGALRTGVSCVVDNTLFWVGDNALAYRMGAVPEAISDAAISEKIANSASVSAYPFTYEGHPFFVVRLDTSCWAFDASTKQWSELHSYGEDTFAGTCAVDIGGQACFGTAQGIASFIDGHSDFDGPLDRTCSAWLPLTGSQAADNVWIDVNVGRTTITTGQGADPIVEMRASNDGGATFTDWQPASMGQMGKYGELPEWYALGSFDAPGALFQWRCTDPVPFRVSSAFVNEMQR